MYKHEKNVANAKAKTETPGQDEFDMPKVFEYCFMSAYLRECWEGGEAEAEGHAQGQASATAKGKEKASGKGKRSSHRHRKSSSSKSKGSSRPSAPDLADVMLKFQRRGSSHGHGSSSSSHHRK